MYVCMQRRVHHRIFHYIKGTAISHIYTYIYTHIHTLRFYMHKPICIKPNARSLQRHISVYQRHIHTYIYIYIYIYIYTHTGSLHRNISLYQRHIHTYIHNTYIHTQALDKEIYHYIKGIYIHTYTIHAYIHRYWTKKYITISKTYTYIHAYIHRYWMYKLSSCRGNLQQASMRALSRKCHMAVVCLRISSSWAHKRCCMCVCMHISVWMH